MHPNPDEKQKEIVTPSTDILPVDPSWRRQIALFLSGQAITLFGSSLVQYALLWHITLGTQSGAMMTIATIVGLLPTVFLAPLGGMFADRYSRKLLIACADGGVALSTIALLIAFLTGHKDLWIIFVVMGIRAIGAGIQTPTVSAVLPQLVPSDHLAKINGFHSSIQAGVSLLSPLLAGAVLSIAPIQWVLLIDIVTAAIGITIVVIGVHIPRIVHSQDNKQQRPLDDLLAGIRYIKAQSFLRRMMVYLGIINFLAAPVALLTPLQVTRTFSNDVWRLTTIEMALSFGMICGGVTVGLLTRWLQRTSVLGSIMAVLGLLTLALGIPINFIIYNAWMFLSGVLLAYLSSSAITLVQHCADHAFMGRVFSVMTMISHGALPMGMLIFGPLSDRFSVELLLLVTGTIMASAGVFFAVDRTLTRENPLRPQVGKV